MRLTRDRALLAGALAAGAALPWSGVWQPGVLGVYLIGCTGLLLLHERLRATFDAGVALLTSVVLFAGTSLYWTMTRVSGAGETLAFALVAAALLLLPRVPRRPVVQAAVWVAVAAVPLVTRLALPGASEEAAGTASEALFSSTRGLLALTPVAYVGLVGLLAGARSRVVAAAPRVVVLGVWLLSTGWLAPSAVDGRFAHGLTAALALVASGLAFAIERAQRRPWLATGAMVVAAIVWNYWMMIQYTVGTIPKDAPLSFSALVRQQADIGTRPPYVYPFAVPASLWFAWREHVPAERYELLAFEPRRAALDLTFDRAAARFLIDGWEAAGDGNEPHAWIRERRATVAVPLALPEGGSVDVVVTARSRLEEPAMAATLGIEVNGQEIGRVTAPPAAPADLALRVAADVGAIWRAGYNRVTFVSYGVARVDPADQRPPGPIARRLGDRAWPVAISRLRIAPADVP